MREEQIAFIKSYDFMRIGQAVSHGQWQSAAMTIRRMEIKARELELTEFARPLAGLKQAIMRREEAQAKQILSLVVAKRVQLLKRYVYRDGDGPDSV